MSSETILWSSRLRSHGQVSKICSTSNLATIITTFKIMRQKTINVGAQPYGFTNNWTCAHNIRVTNSKVKFTYASNLEYTL